MRRCGRRPHRSRMLAFAGNTRGMSWDTRWMSGSMRCTWTSIGCGASVAGPGWIQRVSGVDVRGRVQSPTRRSITSQAMTAGELPLSKARPRSGAAEMRGCKDPAPAGHGWKWYQDRRATVERGEERAGPGRALRRALASGLREYAVAGVRQIASYSCAGRAALWVGWRDAARADNGSTDDEPASSEARSVNAAHRRVRSAARGRQALAASATTR